MAFRGAIAFSKGLRLSKQREEAKNDKHKASRNSNIDLLRSNTFELNHGSVFSLRHDSEQSHNDSRLNTHEGIS